MRADSTDDLTRGDRGLRVVIVAQEPPTRRADSAGVGYLRDLVVLLKDSGAQVTVIVPDTETSRRASADNPDFALTLIPAATTAYGMQAKATTIAERLAPIRPPRDFLAAVRRDRDAAAALQAADVVDVQWPTMTAALPALRRLAPHARVIATLHDVASQGLRRQRQRARSPKTWARFAVSTLQARTIETRTVALAHTVIVFSDKDRALLPHAARVEVVHPPLAVDPPVAAAPDSAPSGSTPDPLGADVLFVGPLYRGENREALLWFTTEVWPEVQLRRPEARLLVAGRATDAHRALFAHVDGIEFLGFVDDLDPLYARAAAVVAPLRVGAGVKFKVVEALVRGVPVVGTSVAFEGIGDSERTPLVSDSPTAFASALIDVLTDPHAARRATAVWQTWAVQRYSPATFARRIAGIYGVPGDRASETLTSEAAADPDPSPFAPVASVVIPVRNGEHGIARQLSALARQDIAAHLEIILADNGSTDRTVDVARAFRQDFGSLRIVDAAARPGVNHARNAGLRAASADRVLVCDHDDEVHAGWASAMLRALDDADLVGGRLLYVQDPGGQEVGELDDLGSVLGYLPYATGGNMAVRRSSALAIGGFDESFARGHDEVDFSWRVQQSGGRIVFAHDAAISYFQRRSLRARAGQSYHSARTRILLWVRHHDRGDLSPISFRGALVNIFVACRYIPGLFAAHTRDNSARAMGWAWGTLDGHLRYRILGHAPEPHTMTRQERPST